MAGRHTLRFKRFTKAQDRPEMKESYWILLLLMVYIWIGYACILWLFTRVTKLKVEKKYIYPYLSLVLTVHNEERIVARRIKNLLEATYPKDSLEIMVVSDGSTDKTDNIVEAMSRSDHRIRLFKTKGGGKSLAQNEAIPSAKGEIVVLTDAETVFEKDVLKNLIRNFADERVGCVSGKLILANNSSGTIEGSQGVYWKYETLLRSLESRIGVMHTASGQIMAFRKSLFRHFDAKYGDDCIIPLDVVFQGYKVIHEDEAIAYDTFPATPGGELRARTRMTLRNMTCTLSKLAALHVFRFPLVTLSVLSHKVFRWLTPFFMIALFICNYFLLKDGLFYVFCFYCQVTFYLLGLVGMMSERFNCRLPLASQIFSFILANVGFFLGVCRAMAGCKITSYRN